MVDRKYIAKDEWNRRQTVKKLKLLEFELNEFIDRLTKRRIIRRLSNRRDTNVSIWHEELANNKRTSFIKEIRLRFN